jgi:hypothetical protein
MQVRTATEQQALLMFYMANQENGFYPTDYSFEQATHDLATWNVLPVFHHNQPVGAFIQQGPEFHVGVRSCAQKRWLTFGHLDKTINQTVKDYGYICTKAPVVWPDSVIIVPKLERWGFVEWKRDSRFVWYWMTSPWQPQKKTR